MVDVMSAIGIAAPYYNLALVVVALWLFVVLFTTKHKLPVRPWVMIFVGVLIFIVEEFFTIMRALGLINIPVHINGFFELAMVSLFIYGLLVQKAVAEKLKA